MRLAARHWQFLAIPALILAIGAASPQELQPPRNQLPTSAITILEQADQFELLSLDPLPARNEEGSFHGYRVLRRVVISDANTRHQLVSALLQGMRENSGMLAACFNPRHAIHAIHKENKADLVICFECLQVHLFGTAKGEFLVSRTPQPVFNAALNATAAR